MDQKKPAGTNNLQESFEDFFETSLCGFVTADTQGRILRANKKIAEWLHCTPRELKGKRFSDLLSTGGKIYYETHLGPLLRMQGFFDEVVLELSSATSPKLRVMVNGFERRDKNDKLCFIRYTILKASDRLQYEQNLQNAKTIAENELISQKEMVTLREQLIAVLGHDLRNPLSAAAISLELIAPSPTAEGARVLVTLKRSVSRMTELVRNIMEFARTRLGEGIVLSWQYVMLEPVLEQVVSEIRIIHPNKEIITSFEISRPVNCDPHRIAQLLSNLVANAITHGAAGTPVYINASQNNGNLEISVINNGPAIPEGLREQLFTPFTREASRPSQQGLGLGLYVCAEIARAHNAALSFTSSAKETCFTFRMNL